MSVPHTTMSEPWIIKLVQIPERQSRFRSILFDNIAKFSNIKLRYKISTIWTKKECFDWDRREQHWAQDFQTSVISFLVQITTILTAIITMRTKLPERILNSNNYSNEQFYTFSQQKEICLYDYTYSGKSVFWGSRFSQDCAGCVLNVSTNKSPMMLWNIQTQHSFVWF